MNEFLTNHAAFEQKLRTKNYDSAASILIQHCVGMTEETIAIILAQAHTSGISLDFSQLGKQLKSKRHKILNGIESLKKPPGQATTKHQRTLHNTSLYQRS